MLPEKIYYPHDFPLNITIAELTEVPLHYHLDVELVVVLQGSIPQERKLHLHPAEREHLRQQRA